MYNKIFSAALIAIFVFIALFAYNAYGTEREIEQIKKEHSKAVDSLNVLISITEFKIDSLSSVQDSLDIKIKGYEERIIDIRNSHDKLANKSNRQLRELFGRLRR